MTSRTLGRKPRCSRVPPSRALTVRTTQFWRDGRARAAGVSSRVGHALANSVVAVAFWVAVAVPFLTVGHLLGGLQSSGDVAVFLTLVAVNLVALGVGHRYHHPEAGADDTAD